MKLFVLLKRNLISILFVVFVICLVLFSNSNLSATANGLKLWANNVVPSLFPFFVAVELLSNTNVVYYLSKFLDRFMRPIFNVPGVGAFPFIMGLISGYPVGAKIVSNLYSNSSITKDEAERLLCFTNNSGPLFIMGTVGISFYANSTIGLVLLLTHISASITVGIILGAVSRRKELINFSRAFSSQKNSKRKVLLGFSKAFSDQKNSKRKELLVFSSLKNLINLSGKKELINYSRTSQTTHFSNINNKSANSNLKKDLRFSELGEVLGNSIINSIKTILLIGGFVTIFSVIISILQKTKILILFSSMISKILGFNQDLILGLLTGLIEFTNGLSIISSIHIKNISINIILSSFILGFGGISIILQVLSIISKSKLSIKKYVWGKLLHGIIAACYTFLVLLLPMFSFNL